MGRCCASVDHDAGYCSTLARARRVIFCLLPWSFDIVWLTRGKATLVGSSKTLRLPSHWLFTCYPVGVGRASGGETAEHLFGLAHLPRLA